MGQKSNINTLRNCDLIISNNSFNFSNLTLHFFKTFYRFIQVFKDLLEMYGVLLFNENINVKSNKMYFIGTLYYTSRLIIRYKRKCNEKYSEHLLDTVTLISKSFQPVFQSLFYKYKLINKICYSFTVSNNFLNFDVLQKLYDKLNIYLSSIFRRKKFLFLDFLKLSFLFCYNKIHFKDYINYFGVIFSVLHKKDHAKFFLFLEHFFKILIYQLPTLINNEQKFKQILGIKIIIRGKLKGKTRASAMTIAVGSIPLQTLKKNVQFAKTHSYTNYGVFGLQFWIYN